MQVFLPLAPNAEERQVCAERAVEEYDYYNLGKNVLAKIGVDTTHMETQTLAERALFADQTLHTCTTWAEHDIFSYIGEAAVMVMLKEFAGSSFKPWTEAVRTIILDEKIHISHGARVAATLHRATTASTGFSKHSIGSGRHSCLSSAVLARSGRSWPYGLGCARPPTDKHVTFGVAK